jgi:hypothetical protein
MTHLWRLAYKDYKIQSPSHPSRIISPSIKHRIKNLPKATESWARPVCWPHLTGLKARGIQTGIELQMWNLPCLVFRSRRAGSSELISRGGRLLGRRGFKRHQPIGMRRDLPRRWRLQDIDMIQHLESLLAIPAQTYPYNVDFSHQPELATLAEHVDVLQPPAPWQITPHTDGLMSGEANKPAEPNFPSPSADSEVDELDRRN